MIYEIDLSKLKDNGKIEVERLLSLLKNNDMTSYLKDESKVIRKVANKIMGYDKDRELRLRLEDLEDAERIKMTLLKQSKAEGIEEGEKIGIEKAHIKTAKSLLSLGVDLDIIVKSTGLSKEEILKLK